MNSFHSQMRKNKQTLSTPSMRSKQRYGYKIKTAGVRDSSNSKISPNKPYKMPGTGQRGVILNRLDRRMHSPEERKIDHSTRSNDESIVSTASSNSPGGKKSKDSSLQIAGHQLSLRKGGNRFNRSPFSRKPQNNLRNYSKNNYSVDSRVNKFDKKQVLANLNKQYRNKHL